MTAPSHGLPEHEHEDSRSYAEHDREGGGKGLFGWLPLLHGHSHSETRVDAALESNQRGIRAVQVSLVALSATAAFQAVIAIQSGSVALLTDTLHNVSDALTALPLGIAFVLARRLPNPRYTYGYGRAEDIAGAIVVLMIAATALISGYESIEHLLDPTAIDNVGWVVGAAIIGFLGNEAVAVYRMRVGEEIGSAALVADGQHARVDGLTSLAVLFGAGGSALGAPIADPLVGLLITVAIFYILADSGLAIWHRLMDAVDPAIVSALTKVVPSVAGVEELRDIQVRWVGHQLHADLAIGVDEDMPTWESHRVAEEVRHALFHARPHLVRVNVHVEPYGHSGVDHHEATLHHG